MRVAAFIKTNSGRRKNSNDPEWVAEVGLEPTRPCGHRILRPDTYQLYDDFASVFARPAGAKAPKVAQRLGVGQPFGQLGCKEVAGATAAHSTLRGMSAARRVRELLLAGLTGLLLVVLCWDLYAELCPGGVICDAIASEPPWTLLGALAAAPSVWWTWVLRTAHKDQENELARAQHVTAQLLECLKLLQKKDEPHSQVGGVYALERVARESTAAVATVLDVLCAFVRTSRTLPETEAEVEDDEEETYALGTLSPTAGVQTALDVLGRLPLEGTTLRVDLGKTDLRGVMLRGRFDQANFTRSWLQKATLDGQFRGANFQEADLSGVSIANPHEPACYAGTLWPKEGMPPGHGLVMFAAMMSKPGQ